MHKLHLSKRGWGGEGSNLVHAKLSFVVMLNFLCALSLCLSPSLIKSWHLSHQVMKVRRLQSAVSGGRGPDTRRTCAGGRDIWEFRALINCLSKTGSLQACLCRCRWVRSVDGGTWIGWLHLSGLETSQQLGWDSQDSPFIYWKVNAPRGTALQWTNYYIFLWCPQWAVLDTPVTTRTLFSADLSWQDAGMRNVFKKGAIKR